MSFAVILNERRGLPKPQQAGIDLLSLVDWYGFVCCTVK